MRLTPENTALWIVNYKRHEELRQTLKGWLDSFPFRDIFILDNYGELSRNKIIDQKLDYLNPILNIYIIHNEIRPSWMTGAIAQCYNAAYYHLFDQFEWVICSQDDQIIKPGWADCINRSDYLFYLAPMGDEVTCISWDGFRHLGWWDERFRLVGGPENDYVFRAMWLLPQSASISDNHSPAWNIQHNTVGLENYWCRMPRTQEILETRHEFGEMVDSECYQRFKDKWRMDMLDAFQQQRWEQMMIAPAWKDIDLYPSASLHWKQTGRIKDWSEYCYPDPTRRIEGLRRS